MWSVYILKCGDGTLYTGIAKDVQKRFLAHKTGKGGKYTRSKGAEAILYTEACKTKSIALKRESAIKRLSRNEKIRLIDNGKCVSSKG